MSSKSNSRSVRSTTKRSRSRSSNSKTNRAHRISIRRKISIPRNSNDPILRNANNPEYTSCKYFATNEYFKSLGYSGKELEDKVYYIIDGTDGSSENNRLPIFDPMSKQSIPNGLTLFFITYTPGVPSIANVVGYHKTPIIHGFLVNNTPRGYYVYSSWGCSRAATLNEYEEYFKSMNRIGESPKDIENYEIDIIKRKPTRQGPFSESQLREGLSNLKANLKLLFGLTDKENEIEKKSDEFNSVQIQMYRESFI